VFSFVLQDDLFVCSVDLPRINDLAKNQRKYVFSLPPCTYVMCGRTATKARDALAARLSVLTLRQQYKHPNPGAKRAQRVLQREMSS
jgi:hypothetical protein